jgi:hypothetical protein
MIVGFGGCIALNGAGNLLLWHTAATYSQVMLTGTGLLPIWYGVASSRHRKIHNPVHGEGEINMNALMIFSIICTLAAIAIAFYTVGKDAGESYERERAIKSGVAEWRINANTGERMFTYLERENP